MANKMLSSNHQTRGFHALGLISLVLLMQRVGATEFKVGGSKGWTGSTDVSFNQWAEMKRFKIGDSLLFVYQPNEDSVLQVNKDDYEKCNTASPIATFTDGNTSFMFKQSGPYYFISGMAENCHKNEKLVVIVLADRNNKAPSPNKDDNTTMAPPPNTNDNTTMAPPPVPNTDDNTTMASPPSPPPPPSGSSVDFIPSPAPVGEESPSPPPPSAASSTFVSFIGCVGAAFVGSSFILVL